MNLNKIQVNIVHFKQYLISSKAEEALYKWESLKNFQDNWDINTTDLGSMYDKSLQNNHTKRLWKRENYEPKRMMSEFIALDRDYVRFILNDLFDENKNIGNRVDRFIYYCNELLGSYKSKHIRSVDNNHYQDYEMISLYLAFRYPEQYTLYHFDLFHQSMVNLGSRDIPELNDIERYFKVCKTLWKFLEKEEAIWTLHQKRLNEQKHYMGKSLLLVEEFLEVVARNP